MRKLIFLSAALILISVSVTRAQGFHLGVKGGANIFKVDGQSFNQSFKFGYSVGAFAEINFPGAWGIQPEVLFNQTNYQTGNQFSSIYPDQNNIKGKLNYLSIPILLSFKPVPLLSLQVGPQFGILMNGNGLVQSGKDAFKKGDFSMVGGAQLNLMKFKAGARYVIGLNDINDLGNGEKWKNQGFQLYVGLRIF